MPCFQHSYRITELALKIIKYSLFKGVLLVEVFLQSSMLDTISTLDSNDLIIMLCANIIGFSASTSYFRRKIFEHKEILMVFISHLSKANNSNV